MRESSYGRYDATERSPGRPWTAGLGGVLPVLIWEVRGRRDSKLFQAAAPEIRSFLTLAGVFDPSLFHQRTSTIVMS